MLNLLRPHQPGLVGHLVRVLQKYKYGVDLSATGTGKTYVAAAVSTVLQFPTLVVCPKVAQSSWSRAASHFHERFSIVGYEKLRAGNLPFGHWEHADIKPRVYYVCEVCQQKMDIEKPHPCYCHPRGIHCIDIRKKSANRGRFNFNASVKLLIFDEVHRCGRDSLNADMLIAAKRQGIPTLGLSATAACNPLNFRALGYLLDLHNLKTDLLAPSSVGARIARPSFERWIRSFGYRWAPKFHGWKWMIGAVEQQKTMLKLRDFIIPERGVRIDWKDIPGFPARQILAELYDIENPEQINSAYDQMRSAMESLKSTSLGDKDPEHPLTKMLRARQIVEILKVPVFSELGEDYLEKGHSVVFFVNFRQTIDELFKQFPKARIIDGTTEKYRDQWIQEFQSNQVNTLIVTCDAGGVALSLHDLDGRHPRVGLVSPNFSAISMQQVFGRLHRDGGLSLALYRVIFADRTVEVSIYRAVKAKLDNQSALNDGDLRPENLEIRTTR